MSAPAIGEKFAFALGRIGGRQEWGGFGRGTLATRFSGPTQGMAEVPGSPSAEQPAPACKSATEEALHAAHVARLAVPKPPVVWVDQEGVCGCVMASALFNSIAASMGLGLRSAAAGINITLEGQPPHDLAVIQAEVYFGLDVRGDTTRPLTADWARASRHIITENRALSHRIATTFGISPDKVSSFRQILRMEERLLQQAGKNFGLALDRPHYSPGFLKPDLTNPFELKQMMPFIVDWAARQEKSSAA